MSERSAIDRVIVHQCSACWFLGPRWLGTCPSCASVNTLRPAGPEMCAKYFEVVMRQPQLTANGLRPSRRTDGLSFGGENDPIADEEDEAHSEEEGEEDDEAEGGQEEPEAFVEAEPAEVSNVSSFKGGKKLKRIRTGIEGVDHVFSGGIPVNHAFTISASPGGGKSTICRQIAASCCERGYTVMIAAGEEVGEIAELEFQRLNLYELYPKGAPKVLFTGSDDTDAIIAAAKKFKVDLLITDSVSIVTSKNVEGAAGEKNQLNYAGYHFMQAAHASNEYEGTHPFTVLLISHITKDGRMAGTNKFKHWTDGSFTLEHIDPHTLEATEDQEKSTGYVHLRVLGKYRRGSGLKKAYFRFTDSGLEPWDPKDGPVDQAKPSKSSSSPPKKRKGASSKKSEAKKTPATKKTARTTQTSKKKAISASASTGKAPRRRRAARPA